MDDDRVVAMAFFVEQTQDILHQCAREPAYRARVDRYSRVTDGNLPEVVLEGFRGTNVTPDVLRYAKDFSAEFDSLRDPKRLKEKTTEMAFYQWIGYDMWRGMFGLDMKIVLMCEEIPAVRSNDYEAAYRGVFRMATANDLVIRKVLEDVKKPGAKSPYTRDDANNVLRGVFFTPDHYLEIKRAGIEGMRIHSRNAKSLSVAGELIDFMKKDLSATDEFDEEANRQHARFLVTECLAELEKELQEIAIKEEVRQIWEQA